MKKILYAFSLVLALGFASCTSYLDINTDPNSPAAENISISMILPGAEMNIASSYGDYLRITGGYFSQLYAHEYGTSNYVDYSQFEQSATRSSSCYSQIYQRGLNNLKTIQEKATAEEEWGSYLAATVLRCFALQALVDCYGELPYSEALDDANLSPKYDEGKDIYAGLLDELDFALGKVSGGETVGTNFLLPNKTAASWIQFANALKLRILMRESGAVDVSNELDILVAENNFPTSDIAMEGCWTQASGQESPFYAEEFSTLGGSTQINVIANMALINTMQQKDGDGNVVFFDNRLKAFFETNGSGNYVGSISGDNLSNADAPLSTTAYWCRPVASYDMPVYFITVAETEFFLAEYYAKKNEASNAEAHYNAAVEASFESAGVDGAATVLAKYPYEQSNYQKVIGIAKWVALAGFDPFQCYCEVRRLGYPAFGSLTGDEMYSGSGTFKNEDSYVPGTLYTPFKVFSLVGKNQLLQRWPYPESSSSRNSSTPEFKGYTTPIFWAE